MELCRSKVCNVQVTVMRRGEEVGSRGSPSELSPPGGYVDSPHSASFTSAQSEMDDIIIDEILSLEEEQAARRRGVQLGSSLQTSGTIEGGPSRVLAIPGGSAAFLARQVLHPPFSPQPRTAQLGP